MEDNSSDDHQYWLQVLGELGSQQTNTYPTDLEEETKPISHETDYHSYFYLNIDENLKEIDPSHMVIYGTEIHQNDLFSEKQSDIQETLQGSLQESLQETPQETSFEEYSHPIPSHSSDEMISSKQSVESHMVSSDQPPYLSPPPPPLPKPTAYPDPNRLSSLLKYNKSEGLKNNLKANDNQSISPVPLQQQGPRNTYNIDEFVEQSYENSYENSPEENNDKHLTPKDANNITYGQSSSSDNLSQINKGFLNTSLSTSHLQTSNLISSNLSTNNLQTSTQNPPNNLTTSIEQAVNTQTSSFNDFVIRIPNQLSSITSPSTTRSLLASTPTTNELANQIHEQFHDFTNQLIGYTRYSMDQLQQQLLANEYVQQSLNLIQETTDVVLGNALTLQSDYEYQQKIHQSSLEQAYYQKLQQQDSLKCCLLRYTLSSIPWKRRQLLYETTDDYCMNILYDECKQPTLQPSQGEENWRDFSENNNENYSESYQDNSRVKYQGNNWGSSRENNPENSLRKTLKPPSFTPKFLSQIRELLLMDDVQRYSIMLTPIAHQTNACEYCLQSFSISLYRHHCRKCGRSICSKHTFPQRLPIYLFGIVHNVRVCTSCGESLLQQYQSEEIEWKLGRSYAYILHEMIPYQKILTVIPENAQNAMDVLKKAEAINVFSLANMSYTLAKKTLSFDYTPKIVQETKHLFTRYHLNGFAGLLIRSEVVECVEMLRKIADLNGKFDSRLHELTACIYYKLAIDRSLRGCHPDSEYILHHNTVFMQQHPSFQSKEASDEDLSQAIHYSAMVLRIIYEETLDGLLRLSYLQGYELILTNIQQDNPLGEAKLPVIYAIFGPKPVENNQKTKNIIEEISSEEEIEGRNTTKSEKKKEDKEIVIVFRGLEGNTLVDSLLYDIHHSPVYLPSSTFLTNCLLGKTSSLRAATMPLEPITPNNSHSNSQSTPQKEGKEYANELIVRWTCTLFQELAPSIYLYLQHGYKLRFVGHNYGGSIASLFVYFLGSLALTKDYDVKGWSYAGTSGFSEAISLFLYHRMTTIVVHDDMIPRLTAQSIQTFVKELLSFRKIVFRSSEQSFHDVLLRNYSLMPIERQQSEGYDEVPWFQSTSKRSLPLVSPFVTPKNVLEETSMVLISSQEIENPLDSTPLFLPGKILYHYPSRGQTFLHEITSNHPILHQIQLQTHMYLDHLPTFLQETLLETRFVRKLHGKRPKEWKKFNEQERCACCQALFSWYGTYHGAIEEFKERNHCYVCGEIVCDRCCQHKHAIPLFGMLFPKPVCDICSQQGLFAL